MTVKKAPSQRTCVYVDSEEVVAPQSRRATPHQRAPSVVASRIASGPHHPEQRLHARGRRGERGAVDDASRTDAPRRRRSLRPRQTSPATRGA